MEILKHKQQLADFRPLDEQEIKNIAETKETLQLIKNSLKTATEVYDKIAKQSVSCGIPDLSIDSSYRPHQAEEIVSMDKDLGLDEYRSYLKLNFHCELKALGCFLEGLTAEGNYLIIESLTIKRELPKPRVELVLRPLQRVKQ
jgi:hypothetical protein